MDACDIDLDTATLDEIEDHGDLRWLYHIAFMHGHTVAERDHERQRADAAESMLAALRAEPEGEEG